jgi:O-antigen/teichoic acid export membrane protein
MNWIAMAAGMVVPFFLTPIVVRTLGATAYGIWILAVSTVAYLNLLDLGLRSAVIRFVSKATAQGKDYEAKNAIAATLWFRVLISGGVAVLSIALAALFPHLFNIPSDLKHAAQVTVLLCGLGVAITLVSGVFGAVLAAINRYDLLSLTTAVQVLARAAGVIFILHHGGRLVALACWELAVILAAGLAVCTLALKIFPPCRVRLGRPIILISSQIIFSTDNLVVGTFLSVGLVAYYSIGGSLMIYSNQVVGALSTTFIPIASGMDASGKTEALQKLLLRGTQGTLALVLPIGITLLLRGKTFIGLWMGKQYSEISGTVLQILLITLFFTVANNTASNIMFGTGNQKTVAKWSILEAAANLTLSIVLVKTIGIYGVAWGTSITMSVIHLIFWPRFVQKTLGVPVRKYVWDGWFTISLFALPFAIATALVEKHWPAKSLSVFFLQVFSVLPIYVLSSAAFFRKEALHILRQWRTSRLERAQSLL